MKNLFISTLLLSSVFCFSQSYESEMSAADNFIKNKDYCSAVKVFEKNLKQDKSSNFEYYYASVSAINCNNDKLALTWLQEAVNKGLGMKEGEVDYLVKDPNFEKVHDTEAWKQIISSIKANLAKKKDDWIKLISQNALPANKTSKHFQKANAGYALYLSKAGTENVPYLVFVPKTYDEKKASRAVVFLHGGVVSISDYYYDKPDVVTEPIFKFGEDENTIIIYPFAKKDFGWVNQIEAFKNVVAITKEVEKKYNIDKNKIVLGGMSNGGTATFWFATQPNMPYSGYFAVSATPKLKVENVDFKKISKSFYSINAKDDDIFKYDEVHQIYEQNKNKNWHFETQETGGHGLIYNENGGEILTDIIRKTMK